jgi:hypothetical protein
MRDEASKNLLTVQLAQQSHSTVWRFLVLTEARQLEIAARPDKALAIGWHIPG